MKHVLLNMATGQCGVHCLCDDQGGSKTVTCKICRQTLAYYGRTTKSCDHLQNCPAVYIPESCSSSDSILKDRSVV